MGFVGKVCRPVAVVSSKIYKTHVSGHNNTHVATSSYFGGPGRSRRTAVIECYVSQRRVQWTGSVMRMKVDRLPRQLISSWVNHSRPVGRPLLNYGQSLDKDLRRVGFGAKDNWTKVAQDKSMWAKITKEGLVSARLADIQKKNLDSVARERAKQVARSSAVHLEARRLARVHVAGP
jgi:hypothetical protein